MRWGPTIDKYQLWSLMWQRTDLQVPFLLPVAQMCLTGSIYLTLAIAIERYTTVCHPFFKVDFVKKKISLSEGVFTLLYFFVSGSGCTSVGWQSNNRLFELVICIVTGVSFLDGPKIYFPHCYLCHRLQLPQVLRVDSHHWGTLSFFSGAFFLHFLHIFISF